MKTIKAYKVVRRSGKGLYSAIGIGKRVRYSTKHWTHQPENCGPLACFSSKVAAINFASSGRTQKFWRKQYSIFQCEIVKAPTSSWYSAALYAGGRTLSFNSLPFSTILAKKVRLIKKVA